MSSGDTQNQTSNEDVPVVKNESEKETKVKLISDEDDLSQLRSKVDEIIEYTASAKTHSEAVAADAKSIKTNYESVVSLAEKIKSSANIIEDSVASSATSAEAAKLNATASANNNQTTQENARAAAASAASAKTSAEQAAASAVSSKTSSEQAVTNATTSKTSSDQAAAKAKESALSANEAAANAKIAKEHVDLTAGNVELSDQEAKAAQENSGKTQTELEKAIDARTKAEEALVAANQAKKEAEQALFKAQEASKQARVEAEGAANAHNLSTTVGLAGAFNEKAQAAANIQHLWSIALFAAVAMAIGIGIWRFPTVIEAIQNATKQQGGVGSQIMASVGIETSLSLLSLAGPLWLAWMSTRMISKYFALSEDYSYKAALAKAYLGFKKQSEGLDKIFEERLFAATITQLDANPTRFIDSSHPGSPLQDLLQQPFMQSAMKDLSFRNLLALWFNKTFKVKFELPSISLGQVDLPQGETSSASTATTAPASTPSPARAANSLTV